MRHFTKKTQKLCCRGEHWRMNELLPLADGHYLTFVTAACKPDMEGRHISSAISRRMAQYPDFELVDVSFTPDGTTFGMSSYLVSLRLRRVIANEDLVIQNEQVDLRRAGRA